MGPYQTRAPRAAKPSSGSNYYCNEQKVSTKSKAITGLNKTISNMTAPATPGPRVTRNTLLHETVQHSNSSTLHPSPESTDTEPMELDEQSYLLLDHRDCYSCKRCGSMCHSSLFAFEKQHDPKAPSMRIAPPQIQLTDVGQLMKSCISCVVLDNLN